MTSKSRNSSAGTSPDAAPRPRRRAKAGPTSAGPTCRDPQDRNVGESWKTTLRAWDQACATSAAPFCSVSGCLHLAQTRSFHPTASDMCPVHEDEARHPHR